MTSQDLQTYWRWRIKDMGALISRFRGKPGQATAVYLSNLTEDTWMRLSFDHADSPSYLRSI